MPGGRYRVVIFGAHPFSAVTTLEARRLLGLYHALGSDFSATYVNTGSCPENSASLPLRESLEEVTAVDNDKLRALAVAADILVFCQPQAYSPVADVLEPRRQMLVYHADRLESMACLQEDESGSLSCDIARLECQLCQAVDYVVTSSHQERQLFQRLYDVPFAKILVVPDGTFTARIRPSNQTERHLAKRALGVDSKPLVLFCGNVIPADVEAAVFIGESLAPAMPDIGFAICGGVATAPELNALARIGAPNIRMAGALDDDKEAAYLAAADLAIEPLLYAPGSTSTLLDYLASGLPTVCTPASAEAIKQGPEVPIHICDRMEFSFAIRRLLEDKNYAPALSEKARQIACEMYSWERKSAQIGLRLRRAASTRSQQAPFFSLLVPSYERHEHLARLLECLRNQTIKDFEVIVVDQSREAWDRAGGPLGLDLLYIHTDVKGAVIARNTAAVQARGNVLAFTDDDCQPHPDWLENAQRYFDNPRVVGVEGLILSDKRDDDNYRAVSNAGFEGIGFMTANLFIRRETFMAIDGFDERFDRPHFREDTDLGWRALRLGEILFGRDVIVYHPPHPRQLGRESLSERARFFEKDALLLQKHPELYKQLFIREGHYARDEGFWTNFFRGVEKYNAQGVILQELAAAWRAEAERCDTPRLSA